MPRAAVAVCGVVVLLLSGGASKHPGSAAVTGVVTVQPLHVDLFVAETSVKTGQRVRVQAAVRNRGREQLRDVRLILRVPGADLHLSPFGERNLVGLPPDQVRAVTWSVCAERAGNYGLLARAELDHDGRSLTAESDTVILQVVDDAGWRPGVRGCSGRVGVG